MEEANNELKNREITLSKIINAPIDLVWKVWTNAGDIANWWGPTGFTNTIHQMDVMPDGEWRLTMHGPDGKNYANKSVFVEIVPLQKIVLQHFNPNYLATVLFEPTVQGTLITWTMLFETVELFETVVKVFKADEGLKQNIDKLEIYLKQIKK